MAILRLVASLTFRLMDPVANPATIVAGLSMVTMVFVADIVVSNVGNQVLVGSKEVIIMVMIPLVGFGHRVVMILLFFLCFSPISLFCSVPLLPLHSTPPLTHDPLIFPYFINHCHTLRFSALLC